LALLEGGSGKGYLGGGDREVIRGGSSSSGGLY